MITLTEFFSQYSYLRTLVGTMAMSNLFDLHPPLGPVGNSVFQIDGNFGGVSGVVEMLVQSRPNGDILLLPALPLKTAASKMPPRSHTPTPTRRTRTRPRSSVRPTAP